jgi:hypothetical protein
MSTEGIVSEEMVDFANAEVRALGRKAAMRRLRQVEPDLFCRIVGGIRDAMVALDDTGVESEVREAVANEVARTALTCVYALRVAHYALWRDTVAGSLLLQIDPNLPDVPDSRRNDKDPGTGGDADAAADDDDDREP